LCCKPDDQWGNYDCQVGNDLPQDCAKLYFRAIYDFPGNHFEFADRPDAACDFGAQGNQVPPYFRGRVCGTGQQFGCGNTNPNDPVYTLKIMPSMWPYCPNRPGCPCDSNPQAGEGTVVAGWARRVTDMSNLAVKYTQVVFKERDIASRYTGTVPSRTQDQYLINFLVAVDTEIIVTTNRQSGIYTPDGPVAACNPLLPPFFNATTNKTYPNPAFLSCLPSMQLSRRQ